MEQDQEQYLRQDGSVQEMKQLFSTADTMTVVPLMMLLEWPALVSPNSSHSAADY